MPTKYHKPNLTLKELSDECQAVQEQIPAKLVHLQAIEVEIPVNEQNHFNEGRYVEIGVMDRVPVLKFVPVDDPDDIPSIIAGELQKHFLLIFDEILYIANAEQRVLGFAKT